MFFEYLCTEYIISIWNRVQIRFCFNCDLHKCHRNCFRYVFGNCKLTTNLCSPLKWLRHKYVYFVVLHTNSHDDAIKWKNFPRYWPFVRGIHRSPLNSPHKGQWRGVLMFPLICPWIDGWANNHEAGDLRRHRAHYDVIGMHADHSRSEINHIAHSMILSERLFKCLLVIDRFTFITSARLKYLHC